MKTNLRITAPNSLVLVMDLGGAMDIPRVVRGRANVAGTRSCIAIGTRSAQDGETSLSVSDEGATSDEEPTFDGTIDTPKKKVSICSVLLEPLVECEVASGKARVRIWTNHPAEPDDVRIVVQPLFDA
ncbi:MAG TPA: hypothetical protein VGI39_24830 [Polyangiaceae bacterium]|jgi:hypothetical protein